MLLFAPWCKTHPKKRAIHVRLLTPFPRIMVAVNSNYFTVDPVDERLKVNRRVWSILEFEILVLLEDLNLNLCVLIDPYALDSKQVAVTVASRNVSVLCACYNRCHGFGGCHTTS